MKFSLVTCLVSATIISFFPIFAVADTSPGANQAAFKTDCLTAWLARGDSITDRVAYQNFGDKFCTCASMQPQDSPAAIKQSAQICMPRTLLHDTMDTLEDDVGLSDIMPGDIDEYCTDKWDLLYPTWKEIDKKTGLAWCECAKPKLINITSRADKMTDKAYDLAIDGIADVCSGWSH